MEVHREDAVDADGLEALGDDARGDRLARLGLLVLAGVAVPGHDGDDPVGGSALGGVDHHQELRQRVVRRHVVRIVGRRRLDEEDIGAADRFLVAAVDLPVGEGLELYLAQLHVELTGDLGGELHRRAPAEHHQALGVLLRDRAQRARAFLEHAHEFSVSSSSLASRAFLSA
jgi:hypothetical protein